MCELKVAADGSADVYEFTISEDQLTPTPIPITDETVVVQRGPTSSIPKSRLSLTGRAVVGDTWIIGLSLQQHWFGFPPACHFTTVVPADIGADGRRGRLAALPSSSKQSIESSDRKF